MARVCSLFSGSKGNSTYISCGSTGILVDCGVSNKRLTDRLADYNIAPEAVSAVLITHEHTDHIQGLPVFLKHYPVPVYATAGTVRGMIAAIPQLAEADLRPIDVHPFCVGDAEVSAFSTPHDANESCGYRIQTSDGRKIAVCTDLGHISLPIDNALNGCDLVVLESNHDLDMLKNGIYPAHLKQRVMGMYGHLSNKACADFLPKLLQGGTTRIILGHISQENNSIPLALHTATQSLQSAGYRVGNDCVLVAATPCGVGKMFVL